MFYLKANINVPWKEKWDDIWCKDFGFISPHKCLEMQLMKDHFLIGIELNFGNTFKGRDHAGPTISISFFGYTFAIQIYDIRHWDYDKNTWEDENKEI